MDPRPYHYQYRRPRLDNPTFESLNLFESLYHRGSLNRYENTQEIGTFRPKNQFQRQIYQHSVLAKKGSQVQVQPSTKLRQFNPDKISSSLMPNSFIDPSKNRPYSNRSNLSSETNIKQQKSSVLASYGRNTIPNQKIHQSIQIPQNDPKIYQNMNQFSIYQKQQKPYSIIGNIPRSVSTSLREYPKLTLQHKLIQQGKYWPK